MNVEETVTVTKAAAVPVFAAGAKALKVYPNPTSGQFMIQLYDVVSPKLTLQVMDQHGKVIEQKVVSVAAKTSTLNIPMNLTNQPAGVYMIKVFGSDGVQSAKVVVTR